MIVANEDELIYINALVCGPSGSGKTAFGATAPKPLILAAEQQSKIVIRKHRKMNDLEPAIGILHPETGADFKDIVRACHGPRDEPFTVVGKTTGKVVFESQEWPLTIVIDSVTDAVKMLRDDIDDRVPLQIASDGFVDRNMRRRGAYREESERMFRAFRDVSMHIVWLAILDEGLDEASDGSKRRYAGPSLLAKTHRAALMQTTNVAGVMRRRVTAPETDDEGNIIEEPRIEYGVQLVGPTYLPLKEFRPLEDMEVPNFSSWVERIITEIR
jgi:hypothetical protein